MLFFQITMGNVSNHRDIKLVTIDKRKDQLAQNKIFFRKLDHN